MQVYSGKSVFRGIAIGKISVYRKNEQQVKRVRTEDTKGELARYEAAKAAAIEGTVSESVKRSGRSKCGNL